MRVVIQRVKEASVTVDRELISEIKAGMLILVGIEDKDTDEDISWLCHKIVNLRIFDDTEGVMNKAINDIEGNILVVSQFTLHASTKKGNRPSYIKASKPDFAIPMYERFCEVLEDVLGKEVGRGKFGAYMDVSLINDGPVTILIDSQNKE